jgi:hypothetical protein
MMTTLNGASPIAPNYTAPNHFQTGNIAPTGLDRFSSGGLDNLLNSPSPLDRFTNQPTLLANQPGQTQLTQGRVDVRVQAPLQNGFGIVDNSRYIEISVMPLVGSELGTLNTSNQAQLSQLRSNAADRINSDNIAFHGKTTAELRQQSREDGYYNSPSHQAWAKAAEARSAGQIPASWWMQNDPYGGTAGNGPLIEPTGIYPGTASKIAMGHDTDWTLGRQFGAGPLRDLATMGDGTTHQEFKDRGMFGLWPAGTDNRFQSQPATDYTFGHEDWTVNYTNPW